MAASRQSWTRTTSQQILRKAAGGGAGTSAQGAGLVPYAAEACPLLFREGGGRRLKGRPQGLEPGPERGLFLFQLPQR